ncbi:MAG: Na+/H+ antiporter subunit E [Vicinamibacterales bacterium]
MRRAVVALALAADFCLHVVESGLSTAWIIVRPGPRPTPRVVRLPYEGLSPLGAVVYGCVLSLTPGTTTLDVDLEAQTLTMHVLDGAAAAGLADDARRRLERRLQTVFPGGRR